MTYCLENHGSKWSNRKMETSYIWKLGLYNVLKASCLVRCGIWHFMFLSGENNESGESGECSKNGKGAK